jgi:hypothetical protein
LPAIFVEGLPAVILARRLCGGLEGSPAVFVEGLPAVFVEGWPADHLTAAALTGRVI